MKIIVIALLSTSIILLPVILESFLSVSMNPVLRLIIMLNSFPLHHLAYAQNSTLDEGSSDTGTGIDTGITNITTESDLPNAISGHVSLPKSQQFQLANMEKHKNPVPLLPLAIHSHAYTKGSRIALVVPVFTGAAYNDAFYVFYKHYAGVRAGENLTRNLSLLSSMITTPKPARFSRHRSFCICNALFRQTSGIADAKK